LRGRLTLAHFDNRRSLLLLRLPRKVLGGFTKGIDLI
jgi:hypothetical protein